MKNRSGRTILIIVALTVALAAISTTWDTRRVDAIQDSEKVTTPFGLSSGQTARLSVLNSGAANGILLEWKFFDRLGRVLGQPPDPERQLIPPGQMRSFDLNADELNLPRDRFGRIQVYVLVRAVGNPNEKNFHASLEVFDNATGKTTVFFPTETIKGFNPQPDAAGIQQ
jgi:hypothetical protein